MKNLKTFFVSSLFLMFNVLMCVQMEASLPVYHNTVSEISLGYKGTNLVGDVSLDNGLIFHIHDYNKRDDHVMNTWGRGDVLHFTSSSFHDDVLILSIKREGTKDSNEVEAYAIFDVVQSPYTSLIIMEINDEGEYVKLSDGSVWDFSWYNRRSSKHWKVGERVLVYGNGEKDSYEFINLDTHAHNRSSSAKATFVAH